jgi:hypothetical protein
MQIELEPRVVLIVLIALLIICVICVTTSTDQHCNKHVIMVDTDGTYIIKIDPVTYEKMVDAITNYSLMSNDYNNKLILIYTSTFHLFDMNYGYKAIKKVDDRLVNYPYVPNTIEYPTGNMHNNIQKAIITHITQQIDRSERQFTNDFDADRKIIDVYLNTLFKYINIM